MRKEAAEMERREKPCTPPHPPIVSITFTLNLLESCLKFVTQVPNVNRLRCSGTSQVALVANNLPANEET